MHSFNQLYPPSDRRLLTKSIAGFYQKGCSDQTDGGIPLVLYFKKGEIINLLLISASLSDPG